MKLRTTNQPVSWLQVLFLLVVIVYCSCKKTDTGITDRQQLSGDEFFKKPVNSTAELNAVIELLKKENEKSGFVHMLPKGAGLPVWSKLIVEKPKPVQGDAARGIISDKEGSLLIPLSNDNKTLSALLFAIKTNDQYEFRCYDNNYAYGIAFSDQYSIKERERVMGLFMGMSNYVFGIRAFKSIPKNLFEGFSSMPEENHDTKKLFLILAPGTLPDIFLSNDNASPGPTAGPTKCYWEFTGKCNCAGSDNTPQNCKHPNDECPSGICTKKTCYTLIFDNENGPGVDPPPGNPNNGTSVPPVATSTSNWSNNNGSPLPGPTDNLPNSPCGNTNCTWYAEAPGHHFDTTPSDPDPEPNLCDMSLEDATAALNAITGNESPEEYSITYGNETVDQNGIIRRPVAPVVPLVSLNFGWGDSPPNYSAYFQGVAFKLNEYDSWKWESCNYNYTALDKGTVPPCFEVTHNVNVSPVVISEDKSRASVYITFQFYARVSCLGGLTDRHLVYSGGNRVYNINMSL